MSQSATLKDSIQGRGPPLEEDDDVVEEDIVAIERDMGLEVDTEDIKDLIDEHADELTTEELVALQQEQQEERSMKVTEEEGEEMLITSDIKYFLKQWEAVCSVVHIHHPNKVIAGQCQHHGRERYQAF